MAIERASRRLAASAPGIADAGPLIPLAGAGQLGLLKGLFGRVHVTLEVVEELALDGAKPGVQALRSGLRAGWLAKLRIPQIVQAHPFLDAGEASCLAAASRHAGARLIQDERLGRREARRFGIALIGTAGVLCAAKARGMIGVVVPVLEQMREAGYFLGSNVVEDARRQAGAA